MDKFHPFDKKDAGLFFGRDNEIEEILDRLATHRLLAVIGVSGCGKSSLVRAGVTPILALGAAENLPGLWRVHTITPGTAPLNALRSALNPPDKWPKTSFGLVEQARGTLKPGENLLLIVDQFEELFPFRTQSLSKDAGNQAALFVNLLLHCVSQREVPIYVLLTMRSDFLGDCAQFRGLPEALNDCYYLVPRLTRSQQQEAIERPLEQQGKAITPALVQQLLNDSAEDPDHLPVLQHLLKRLWENSNKRNPKGPIGDEDYQAVGGWQDALNQDADAVLSQFISELDNIRRLFVWITDRGTGEKPVRRPQPFSKCAEASGLSDTRLTAILKAFQNRGLLKNSNHSPSSIVDLPHESVMWQWKSLSSWIAKEVERATQLHFICQSAQQQVILTGLALDSAIGLRSDWKKQPLPTLRYLTKVELQDTDQWIVRSEKEHNAALRRRFWKWIGISAAVVLGAAFAVYLSLNARREAEERQAAVEQQRKSGEARELSAWSAVSLSQDPERSLVLGLYAWSKNNAMVPGLAQTLHEGLMLSQSRLTLDAHHGSILCAAWSPNASKIAIGAKDKTLTIWDANTDHLLLTLDRHQDSVTSLAWSPDGQKLATGSKDRTVRIWAANSGKELMAPLSHKSTVWSVAWSPNGLKLASGSEDGETQIWDATTGHPIRPLSFHKRSVECVAWSSSGNMLATASKDETVVLWNVNVGRKLHILRAHEGSVESVAWSPNGRHLATATSENSAKIWRVDTGARLFDLLGHRGSLESIAWSPDGRKLATASDDNTVRTWDANSGGPLLTLRGHKDVVWTVAWSPDSTRVISASEDGTTKVWDAVMGRELVALIGHKDVVESVQWSHNGKQLATSSGDGTTRVWDASTGNPVISLNPHQRVVWNIAWSPDDLFLATAGQDGTVKIWSLASTRESVTVRNGRGDATSVAWSPDGSQLAITGQDGAVNLWDPKTGRRLLALSDHPTVGVQSVSWSPHGESLVTGSDDATLTVWDAKTGKSVFPPLTGHKLGINSLAWSPDGNKLASASDDKTLCVWDAKTGHNLATLRGHLDSVTGVAWSPDSKTVASASSDHTVKLWNAESGRELLTLSGGEDAINTVAWSPDGKHIAAGGFDNVVQLYAVDPTELLHIVRNRITDNSLTLAECQKYLDSDNCPPLPNIH